MNFIYDPSLVLYLPLYEMDGSSFMSRDAHGHSGTVTGALWRPNGHYFDGTDDTINCGTSSFLSPTDSVSVTVWVYFHGITGEQDFVSSQVGGTYGYGFYKQSTGHYPIFLVNGLSPGTCATTAYTVSILTWYQFTGVYDASAGKTHLYANGHEIANNSVTGIPVASTEALRVGSYRGTSGWMNGLIGEVLIHSRALTPQEILNYYLATKWRYQ